MRLNNKSHVQNTGLYLCSYMLDGCFLSVSLLLFVRLVGCVSFTSIKWVCDGGDQNVLCVFTKCSLCVVCVRKRERERAIWVYMGCCVWLKNRCGQQWLSWANESLYKTRAKEKKKKERSKIAHTSIFSSTKTRAHTQRRSNRER